MTDPNAGFAAAVARHQAGDVTAAEQMYRAVLAEHPAHAPTLCNLGVILVRAGKVDEAVGCYNLALAASPGHADAHFNLGNIHRRANRLRDAADHYQSCLTQNPQHAGAAFNLGLVYSAVGELAAAAECFRTVVKLEPAGAEGYARLGDVLVRAGKVQEGVTAFHKSVELKPDDPRGLYNYGLALSNAGRYADAHDQLQKALKLDPRYAEAHNALGLNLEHLGRKDDAQFHYQEAVRLKPDLADAWSNLGTNLVEQGRADDAIAALRESLRVRPHAPAIHSNLVLDMNYSSRVTPEEVRDESLAWAAKFAGPTPPAPPPAEPHDPDRRLRVAYLSADYRTHTVAAFLETLLRHHDRDRVEVFAYANVLRPDTTTDRLKELADYWRPVGGLPDEYVLDYATKDQLDVLVDLSGHTAGNRLTALAKRAAPVQATVFGYPNTTGLKAVDYRISDPVSDPEGATDDLYAEAVLRLPDVPWVYVPPDPAPPLTPLPGLGQRQFTLGCLNNAAKISDACLEAWVAVLQAVPGTKLMLLAGQSQAGAKRLTDRFVKAGVLRERVEMILRLPKQQYYEAYRQFDLSLDPFPYNGGVTTGDSLWMGVPVLTVAGTSYVARQGLMALNAVGLNDFIADSPETLVHLVRHWSNNRQQLAEIRAGLRDRVAASPLADGPRYVRNLEDALRRVWRERLPK